MPTSLLKYPPEIVNEALEPLVIFPVTNPPEIEIEIFSLL